MEDPARQCGYRQKELAWKCVCSEQWQVKLLQSVDHTLSPPTLLLPVSLPRPQVTLHDLDLVKEAGALATNG